MKYKLYWNNQCHLRLKFTEELSVRNRIESFWQRKMIFSQVADYYVIDFHSHSAQHLGTHTFVSYFPVTSAAP